MKLVTPEISWHQREPIYSIDLQPCQTGDNYQRMATCGVDRVVRVWNIRVDNEGKVEVDFLSNLRRHSATVNACRFSPDGKFLATAADDQIIFVWKLSDVATPANNIFSDEDTDNKETWVVHKTLRGHLGDVLDLCWSQDGRNIVSGSVDNSAIVWDIQKDIKQAIFTEHKSYVQGVAWDPLREYMATLSSDRSLRIFNLHSRHCMHNVSKMVPRLTATQEGSKIKAVRIFHDETLRSFFRRLAFTPDGQLLIAPAGIVDTSEGQRNATYIFVRGSFKEPAMCLPSPDKATVAVRICPLLFKLRPVPVQTQNANHNNGDGITENAKEWEKYSTVFSLPYRMVFAVATETEVVLYDTQQTKPFGYVTNIHYHTLCDLSWSSDGRFLVVASTDGYCSVITFDDGELGELFTPKPAVSASVDIKSVETAPVRDVLMQTTTSPVQTTPAAPEEMEVDCQSGNNDSAVAVPDVLAAASTAVAGSCATPAATTAESSLSAGMKTVTISPQPMTTQTLSGNVSTAAGSAKQPKRIQFTTLSLNKTK